MKPYPENELAARAVAGDRQALEELMKGIQDTVFNLSLRMLGSIPDAEDASQDIFVRILTNLSSFRGESSFRTWVWRLAVNHLLTARKGMFAQHPLSFEFYGEDILRGSGGISGLAGGADRELLARELKLSCTNVMLQCLDPESRCVFILGTMFRLDSRLAGEILDMTPENYRQKLSRTRKKMAEFLSRYCGAAGGACSCAGRVDYAVSQHRLDPARLEYSALEPGELDRLEQVREEMEQLDGVSAVFQSDPVYRSPVKARELLEKLLRSPELSVMGGN